MRKIILLSFILLSVSILYAKPRKKNAANLPLLHTKWVLKEIYETRIYNDTDTAFIIFTENFKLSGNLGCNLFFGEFSYGKKKIKLDYLGATKKYCMDMSVEEKFVKAIKNDKFHYYIERNKLYFLIKNKTILKFEGLTL